MNDPWAMVRLRTCEASLARTLSQSVSVKKTKSTPSLERCILSKNGHFNDDALKSREVLSFSKQNCRDEEVWKYVCVILRHSCVAEDFRTRQLPWTIEVMILEFYCFNDTSDHSRPLFKHLFSVFSNFNTILQKTNLNNHQSRMRHWDSNS